MNNNVDIFLRRAQIAIKPSMHRSKIEREELQRLDAIISRMSPEEKRVARMSAASKQPSK
jgi:hypothetical protein